MEKAKKNINRRLLSVGEVSEIIGLARQTIYNQLSQGLFPVKHKKIGRLVKFDSQELEKYVNSLRDHW